MRRASFGRGQSNGSSVDCRACRAGKWTSNNVAFNKKIKEQYLLWFGRSNSHHNSWRIRHGIDFVSHREAIPSLRHNLDVLFSAFRPRLQLDIRSRPFIEYGRLSPGILQGGKRRLWRTRA